MIPSAVRLRSLVGLLSVALAACSGGALIVETTGRSHTLTVARGDELRITLQTVGPGEYESPPSVSSPALRFLDESFVSPAVPAGPTQLFRFRAEARGAAVVAFHHTWDDHTVEDTVLVR